MAKRIFFTLTIFLISIGMGYAQKEQAHQKIGLVLSGGGAKCLSQIGVLRVIEESGIEIDYIAGTSMGAIIGSMYAMGYTVDEIEYYLRKVDWDAIFSNEIPRDRLSYFDRKTESRYLLTFPIRNRKIELPSAFNDAYHIQRTLCYLTQKSSGIQNFEDFKIPFLCVATNLETGEMHQFESGSLSDALRASSAFPSLFTPFELDSHLYVDGGVANNFPVEPLLEKGMDYIIGVDVQGLLYDKKGLNSMVRILEQTSSFMNSQEYERRLESTDLLIKPNIEDASITSFDMFDILVARGEEAAREQLPNMLLLNRTKESRTDNTTPLLAIPDEEFTVDSISIIGLKSFNRRYVLGKLRVNPNEKSNIKDLEEGLDRLYGSKNFKTVDYELINLDTSRVLQINLVEDASKVQFRFGLHYDSDFKTALLLNYTQRNLLLKNSRFTAEVALGDNIRSNIQYIVDRGMVPSMGIKFRTNSFDTKIYEGGEVTESLNYSDLSLDLFLQSTVKDIFAIGIGIQLEGSNLSRDIKATNENDEYQSFLNYYAFLDFDNFNDAYYPTKGTKTSVNARLISEYEDFNTFYSPSSVIDFSFGQAISFSKKISMVASAKGIFTIGNDLEFPYNVFLGSMGKSYINYITPFIGFRYMELPGRNTIIVRADANFEIFKDHYIIAKANWGKLENSFQQTIDSDIILDGYSIGYSYNSVFGPLELSVTGSTNHSRVYTYLSLGFWF